MNRKIRPQAGFTLIEIMMVIAIISILATVLIPKSGIFKDIALESGTEANLRTAQALVSQLIYDWDGVSGGYKYAASVDGATNLERDLRGRINNPDKSSSTLKNPITRVSGMDTATLASFTNGGAVAFIDLGSTDIPNEWPVNRSDMSGVVGVSAYLDSADSKLKVRLVSYDTKGNRLQNQSADITIIRH